MIVVKLYKQYIIIIIILYLFIVQYPMYIYDTSAVD